MNFYLHKSFLPASSPQCGRETTSAKNTISRQTGVTLGTSPHSGTARPTANSHPPQAPRLNLQFPCSSLHPACYFPLQIFFIFFFFFSPRLREEGKTLKPILQNNFETWHPEGHEAAGRNREGILRVFAAVLNSRRIEFLIRTFVPL